MFYFNEYCRKDFEYVTVLNQSSEKCRKLSNNKSRTRHNHA